jgi:hypothetical protein
MATNQFKTIQQVLVADIEDAETLTVSYPAGTTQADFIGANAGATADNVVIIGSDRWVDPQITTTFNAPSVAILNSSGTTWRTGQTALIQLGQVNSSVIGGAVGSIAPLAADADLPTAVAKVNEIIAKTS